MKPSDLNKISIANYLANSNIYPVKRKEYETFYLSPFRKESNPSFKVDTQLNVWYDFGLGKGGQLIDLVMLLDNATLYQTICKLEKIDINIEICSNVQTSEQTNAPTNSFSFHGKETTPTITIQKVTELVHPALLQYLDQRAINASLAREHCKQIHYATNNRNYFAIGLKNDSEGWNLRSEYFKGCTSMDISTCRTVDRDTALVFEGFMDYLSYLAINKLRKPIDSIIVLNSTSNLNKAIDFIKSHKKVYTYLDNDEGGRKATQQIKEVCKTHNNKSTEFANFKDLNEFHIASQKGKKQDVKQKPSRGFKL